MILFVLEYRDLVLTSIRLRNVTVIISGTMPVHVGGMHVLTEYYLN